MSTQPTESFASKAFEEEAPGSDAFEHDRYEPIFTIHESSDAYDIECDLPHADRDGIKVRPRRHAVEISCTHAVDHQRPRHGFGAFTRKLPLHCAIEAGAVQTRFDGGHLVVHVPKAH